MSRVFRQGLRATHHAIVGLMVLGSVSVLAAGSAPEAEILPETTPDPMREIAESFALFDRDNDRSISQKELGQVMVAFGDEPTEQEVRAMIAANDKSGDGTIDFPEFVRMMSQGPTRQEVRAAFVTFDRDNDEYIDRHELKSAMANIGEELGDDEVSAMIDEVDDNGDRMVDYPEFVEIMTR